MKKRFLILFTTTLILFSALQAQQDVTRMNPTKTTQKYAALLQMINGFYVDTLDMNRLTEEAIVSTLKELDPHSAYIPKSEVEKANEPLEGSFEGVGLSFQLYKDTILVISPIPGGPSDKVGLLAGDKIIKVNGENAFGEKITNQWVMDHLRGKKGTEVTVSIYRRGVEGLLDYTIVRDKIPLNSIDAAFMLDNKTGYIKLNRFARNSLQEFNKAIEGLKARGMVNLVFDLRFNSGGYLATALSISDEFLSSGKLVVYTQGVHSPRQELDATNDGELETGKLVVLINEGSASASEIVSGAIQDWDRGVIIGRRSFGKGLVQRPFRLPDGSVVRLTVARYYTPSGRCIQKPYNEGVDEYYKDFAHRFAHGELESADSIHFPDSLKYKTSAGRTVYGGGGIMPDIFIPWDSARFNKLYSDLIRNGIFNSYVNDYLDLNRQSLEKKYPSFKDFNKHFFISDDDFNEFISRAKDKITINEKQLNPNIDYFKEQIKALIARNLFNTSEYFEVLWPDDEEISKALDVINDDMVYNHFGKTIK